LTAPPPDGPDRPPRPGASTFTIEGRAAPGLFVVGWLATIFGLGAIVIAFMAGRGTGQPGPAIPLLIGGLLALSVGLVAGAGSQGMERRARGGRNYVGPSPFLVFAAAVPISQLVLIAAGTLLVALGVDVESPVATLISVALQAVVYIGLIRLLVVDGGFLSWADMRISRPSSAALVELTLGAGWALPVIVATIPIALFITQFLPVPPQSPLPPTGEAAGLALHLLAGVIVAPISEEVLFRGFATTAWTRDMGVTRGVIRGALFFALAHVLTISGVSAGQALGAALAAFLGRIPVAFALGWLFARRESIWAPLGLHAAFNGMLLILQEIAARNVPGV
jgi:membrane protease YdiL (CAAX protease family)